MSKVFDIKNVESMNRILSSSYRVVVIDIYADWCSPCKYLAPKMESLADTYKDESIMFCKLDTKTNLRSNVKGLPTIEFWVQTDPSVPRELVKTIVGADVPEIEKTLKQLFNRQPGNGIPVATIAARQQNHLPPAHLVNQQQVSSPAPQSSSLQPKPAPSKGNRKGTSYKKWSDM